MGGRGQDGWNWWGHGGGGAMERAGLWASGSSLSCSAYHQAAQLTRLPYFPEPLGRRKSTFLYSVLNKPCPWNLKGADQQKRSQGL